MVVSGGSCQPQSFANISFPNTGGTSKGQLANHHDNGTANQQPAALPVSALLLPVSGQVKGLTS